MHKSKRNVDQEVLDKFRASPCIICGHPSDPAHIRTRGAGGHDEPWNVIAFCRTHHNEQGSQGWVKMWRKYPMVMIELKAKGWEILKDNFGEKLVNTRGR